MPVTGSSLPTSSGSSSFPPGISSVSSSGGIISGSLPGSGSSVSSGFWVSDGSDGSGG